MDVGVAVGRGTTVSRIGLPTLQSLQQGDIDTRRTATTESDVTYLWIVVVGALSILHMIAFVIALAVTVRRSWRHREYT